MSRGCRLGAGEESRDLIARQHASNFVMSASCRVLAVNEHDCTNRAYLETLNLVKTTPRPMKIVLQEGKLADDECISGYCLLRKSVGPIPPSQFATWKRRYFVLGGAVANKNVLQVYKSKRDYEHVVVSLFERRPIVVKLKVSRSVLRCQLRLRF